MGLEVERLFEVFAFDGEPGESAQRFDGLRFLGEELVERFRGGGAIAALPSGESEIDKGFLPIRAFSQAGFEGFFGAFVLIAVEPEKTETEPCFFPVGVLRQKFLVEFFGVFLLALHFKNSGEVEEDFGEIGGNGECLFVGLPGAGQIVQFLLDRSEVGEGLFSIGADAERFSIAFGGLVEAAQFLAGDSIVVPAFVVIRRQIHQFLAELGGGFKVAALERARGQPFECRLGVRTEDEQLVGILPNLVIVFAGDGDGDEVGQRLFRFRIRGERILIDFGGFVEAPQQLQGDGLAELCRLVGRILLEVNLKLLESGLRLFQMQEADAETEARFGPVGFGGERGGEPVRGGLPLAKLFVSNGLIEQGDGIVRGQFE